MIIVNTNLRSLTVLVCVSEESAMFSLKSISPDSNVAGLEGLARRVVKFVCFVKGSSEVLDDILLHVLIDNFNTSKGQFLGGACDE